MTGVQTCALPILIIIGFKIFPYTPVGRKMILKPKVESVSERGANGVADGNYLQLLSAIGKTVTQLRPCGIAEINGQRYSVVTEGQLIEKDVDIVVVNVEGNSIVVEQQDT